MEFEYDPNKEDANLEKHGIDFLEAQKLWAVRHVIVPAAEVSGEQRWAIVGELRGELYVAVFAWRGERVRLISCHRASERLARKYAEKIYD